ncbi:MAG: hypothetical protein D6798_16550 [Deltaproteobacteria bacterium]|nr:MAG: hypothetical protein D6798_16550 [Deltaproteobacteria bacterium]
MFEARYGMAGNPPTGYRRPVEASMSDDTRTSTETDSGRAEGEPGDADAAPRAATSRTPRVGMQGLLTRDSDLTARPGFRNPANTRSKASKKKRRKKKR